MAVCADNQPAPHMMCVTLCVGLGVTLCAGLGAKTGVERSGDR